MTSSACPAHASLERLKDRRQFLKIAAAGTKWVMPGLVLQARASGSDSEAPRVIRVGFTTSKKVGGAVDRNRARRRLKALASEVMTTMAAPGFDYVLIGRRSTVMRPYPMLRNDLEMALRRLKLMRPLAQTDGAGRRASAGKKEDGQ